MTSKRNGRTAHPRPQQDAPEKKPASARLPKTASFAEARAEWEAQLRESKPRPACFDTLGGEKLDPLYFPTNDPTYLEKLGFPGQYPFTRGPYGSMYRGRLWTMRQFAGFGAARQTNQRYKFLLERGQTGLSVAFDMPTLMGYDSDHARAEGEVGKCGVAIASLEDMETLFEDIPLDQVTISMTINGPAPIIWAYLIACAEKRGVPRAKIGGTLQNDILKEYQAQKEWLFAPRPSFKVLIDTIEFATREMPKWHPVSISGYHIREAGSTAIQELAFTLANGFAYVEGAIERGLAVDAFGPRLSFFWNSHSDFFEEIAKFRAGRRIWARHMKEKYGATDPKAMTLRFHAQTAGCSLTAQQPENNIVRTAIEALAAVLGGCQSLHTNSLDETLALPSDKAVKIALRTQQVIAEETGVTNVIDPLGGSYFIEDLTDRMEKGAEDYFTRIEKLGGMLAATEKGWVQREIGEAAYRLQQEYERNERKIVGVNAYVEPDEPLPDLLKIDESVAREQEDRLAKLRKRRDAKKVDAALAAVRAACKSGANVMPSLIDAAHAYVTLGETCDAMREVLGTWREGRDF